MRGARMGPLVWTTVHREPAVYARSAAAGLAAVPGRLPLAALVSAAPRAAYAWRDTAWSRVLVSALVMLACAWLALARGARPVVPPVEREISPLPSAPVGCRPRGREAREHALSLERVAAARWERVPFALHEAPRAVAQIAEAEVCFAAANDRSGRTRAAATRRSYTMELERRFGRARLLLRAALRQGETTGRPWSVTLFRARPGRASAAPHVARSSTAIVREQLTILVALLDRASPSALPYRSELEQLARHYAAESLLPDDREAPQSAPPVYRRGPEPYLPTISKPESTP